MIIIIMCEAKMRMVMMRMMIRASIICTNNHQIRSSFQIPVLFELIIAGLLSSHDAPIHPSKEDLPWTSSSPFYTHRSNFSVIMSGFHFIFSYHTTQPNILYGVEKNCIKCYFWCNIWSFVLLFSEILKSHHVLQISEGGWLNLNERNTSKKLNVDHDD